MNKKSFLFLTLLCTIVLTVSCEKNSVFFLRGTWRCTDYELYLEGRGVPKNELTDNSFSENVMGGAIRFDRGGTATRSNSSGIWNYSVSGNEITMTQNVSYSSKPLIVKYYLEDGKLVANFSYVVTYDDSVHPARTANMVPIYEKQ